MIINWRRWRQTLRETARQAGRALGPRHGRHAADSLAGLDWYERTPQPAPSPERLSAPRVVPARLSWPERVKLAYDYADKQTNDLIWHAMMSSRLAWAQSHA
jgi:hypothetical protein